MASVASAPIPPGGWSTGHESGNLSDDPGVGRTLTWEGRPMTAPSIVCPECGEDVPFGRRTCEACGANVTGLATHAEAAGEAPEAPAVEWPRPAASEPPPPEPVEGAPFVPPVLREWNPGSPLPE